MSLAGDLDLVFGHSDGWLDHFENIGTSKAPAFVQRTGFANPFDGFNVGEIQEPTQGDDDDRWERSHSSAPALADFDGDGTFRPCPLIGSDRTCITHFLPLAGDLDVVVGENLGMLRYLVSSGASAAPEFVARTGGANPFDGVVGTSSYWSRLALADIDGNGTLIPRPSTDKL